MLIEINLIILFPGSKYFVTLVPIAMVVKISILILKYYDFAIILALSNYEYTQSYFG